MKCSTHMHPLLYANYVMKTGGATTQENIKV